MTFDPYSQQPPQYPQQQQPPYPPPGWPQQYPPQQFPREAVTTRGDVGRLEQLAWAIAIICTLGLAAPFYWARKRAARRTTVTRYR